MTYSEVEERIGKMTPETFQADALELLKDLKGDYATLDTLSQRIKDNEEKIRTLQDTNARLFLGQTGKPPVEEEEPEEKDFNFLDRVEERTKEQ